MDGRSPSLKALRTFEAAARLKSLTRAAHELHVTVPAVAFQVKQVEEALGMRLLLRNGRNLEVSSEAAALAAELAEAFASISSAVDNVRTRTSPAGVVTISVLPSFLRLWLLPRLARFRSLYPEVDLRISASERLADLANEGIDCAVRCGEGGWSGVEAAMLFPQMLAPVCHSTFAQKWGSEVLKDLPSELLIINVARKSEWSSWFEANGLDRGEPISSQGVEGRELVVDAMAAGLGIGIADVSVLRQELESGQYLQLGAPWSTGWSHQLVTPLGVEPTAACALFAMWLKGEAGVPRD